MENWLVEMDALLKTKTLDFSEQEKENISYSYLVNLLKKDENTAINSNEELQSKVSYLITETPVKTEGKALNYSTKYLNEISNLQTYVAEKCGLVPKGKFKMRFLPLGIGVGWAVFLPLGVAFGNIALGLALGIPIGLAVGIIYGNYLDNRAEKENRSL
jgi:hypothetical protein